MRQTAFSLVLLVAAAACKGDSTAPTSAIDDVRRATVSFQSVATANAAGYTVWSPDPSATGATCPSSADGKMGYHLVNVARRGAASDPAAGVATIEPLKPAMLLYEKRADGTMQLAGVEYLVFKAAWERERGVGAAAPEVLGKPLLASSHEFVAGGPSIPHYELHVWVHKDNPLGMFHPWHPNVTC